MQYREGLYVGYRYFDSFQRPVLFPFGHGLSYTRFNYADLQVTGHEGQPYRVELTLTNAGECRRCRDSPGLRPSRRQLGAPYRPEQELRAFRKVALEAGESQALPIELDPNAFAFYNIEAGRLGDGTGRIRNPRRRVEPGHPPAPAPRGGYRERRARRSQIGRE